MLTYVLSHDIECYRTLSTILVLLLAFLLFHPSRSRNLLRRGGPETRAYTHVHLHVVTVALAEHYSVGVPRIK